MTNTDDSNMTTVSTLIDQGNIAFGTSGARGLVSDFSAPICAAFTLGFLASQAGDSVAIGIDNRPSSPLIASYCAFAAESLGYKVEYCGVLPTPALAIYAMSHSIPSIMITGSHIPFDRNGIKFYRPDGEISKQDEQAIISSSYNLDAPFMAGLSTVDESSLPNMSDIASKHYVDRYTKLFAKDTLANRRIGIYEHSSSGRDLYAAIFERLGAKTISLGRSDQFVPIDTEAVAQEDIEQAKRWLAEHQLDAVFSTDGDGDRPLLSDESGEYLRGDILGLLAAKALGIDSLALPVSCNTSIEGCGAFKQVTRTRIGSPYVIEAFDNLCQSSQCVAGFEANGGFLLASELTLNGQKLPALPTRDAILPVISVLSTLGQGKSIAQQVAMLPQRYTAADRIQGVERSTSTKLIEQALNDAGALLTNVGLAHLSVTHIDQTDGLRLTLSDDSFLHLRPSGNAPELRCYVETDSPQSAQQRVNMVLNAIQKLSV
jgi:phosphomannomutase